MAEVMQLLHAEGIQNGRTFQWLNYFDPEPELLAEFEATYQDSEFELT